MDETLLKALIAAGGVVLGAIVAAVASAYSASQKIRALQLEYAQKLQENYLLMPEPTRKEFMSH